MLGPNGGGKTTTVLALAGVLPLDEGHVRVGGEVWDDGTAPLAPEQRRVGLMLADSLLFPHLRALDNVAYGPRSRGVDRHRPASGPAPSSSGSVSPTAPRRGRTSSRRVSRPGSPWPAPSPPTPRCSSSTSRSPHSTRTRAHGPAATSRARLAAYGGVTVLVTHDPLDALTLADHLVFVEDGHGHPDGHARRGARASREAPTSARSWASTCMPPKATRTVTCTPRMAGSSSRRARPRAPVWADVPAERRVAAPARARGLTAQHVAAAHRLGDDAGPVGPGRLVGDAAASPPR